MTSRGNNFCDFPDEQLTKFHALGNILSQAARYRQPCVNDDTSFLWEPRVTFGLFSGSPLEVRPLNQSQTTWIHACMCPLQ